MDINSFNNSFAPLAIGTILSFGLIFGGCSGKEDSSKDSQAGSDVEYRNSNPCCPPGFIRKKLRPGGTIFFQFLLDCSRNQLFYIPIVILKENGEMIGQCGLTMQPWKDRQVLDN